MHSSPRKATTKPKRESRHLADLISVGPATIMDLALLNIHNMEQLAKANPKKLYEKLCRATGRKHDICTLDVFTCAIAQAKNPDLPKQKCQWHYWSRIRKMKKESSK